MHQEALRSPKLIRARALWKHGILVIPHAYSSIGGEPCREDGEVLCVKHMDDARLEREFQRWNASQKLAERVKDEATSTYIKEANSTSLKAIIAFGAAAASSIGSYALNSSNHTQVPQYPLALLAAGASIKGLFSLKAKSDIERERKEDIIGDALIRGNAAVCKWEMIQRNPHLFDGFRPL